LVRPRRLFDGVAACFFPRSVPGGIGPCRCRSEQHRDAQQANTGYLDFPTHAQSDYPATKNPNVRIE
jgi:hypothetical protein